jgi:hypothetical protein
MKTFWLTSTDTKQSSRSTGSQNLTSTHGDEDKEDQRRERDTALDEKTQRLVDWNTEVLCRFLKLVVARRDDNKNSGLIVNWTSITSSNTTVLEEVSEIITLPNFTMVSSDANVLEEHVEKQLHNYVASIAVLYRNNHFHNYEHASHVTMVSE